MWLQICLQVGLESPLLVALALRDPCGLSGRRPLRLVRRRHRRLLLRQPGLRGQPRLLREARRVLRPRRLLGRLRDGRRGVERAARLRQAALRFEGAVGAGGRQGGWGGENGSKFGPRGGLRPSARARSAHVLLLLGRRLPAQHRRPPLKGRRLLDALLLEVGAVEGCAVRTVLRRRALALVEEGAAAHGKRHGCGEKQVGARALRNYEPARPGSSIGRPRTSRIS